ncbi:MAG: DUF1186 family protein [Prevotellaceae bacterium]|jgi:hypothetical protein|nr:DUF1186 family protein [Prevotellaceae bacterium]
MSKKKKNNNQQILSPTQYIKTKARNLPITECLINKNWQESGLANILVVRQHKSGNYTIGLYLVDIFCLGVKNAAYKFNISEEELEEIREHTLWEPVSYEVVHNIIYGGLAYAEDLGIAPHKDFALSRYILEEDTDEIPLIEYEFGKNGKPFLVANSKLELNKYRDILEKATGGDYNFSLPEDDEDEDDDYDYDNDELTVNLEKFKQMFEKSQSLPHTDYAYKHPEYPKELNLTHDELNVLLLPENNDCLNRETIDRLLALPRETLIKDLEQCVLYLIGQYLDKGQLWQDNVYGSMGHCLLLLGELRAEESLDVVLEVMRQDEGLAEFYFGDYADRFLVLTLYYVGGKQLDKLLGYVKEPGLYISLKVFVFPTLVMLAQNEPERRLEVVEWFREVLNFFYEKRNDSAYFDASLTGLMMGDLIDLQVAELLPEIKQLFDTGFVDEICAGNYDEVKKEISSPEFGSMNSYKPVDIYERYEILLN